MVLYTKPGCCLCDGLKESLDAIMTGGAEVPTLARTLKTLKLETRDVSTNEEWARAYAMEVPVLALVTNVTGAVAVGCEGEGEGDVTEENEIIENIEVQLPRPAPRLSPARLAVRLSQDVEAAMAGKKSGARKGWSTSGGVGADVADDVAEDEPKQSGGSGGTGWAVVSENPF